MEVRNLVSVEDIEVAEQQPQAGEREHDSLNNRPTPVMRVHRQPGRHRMERHVIFGINLGSGPPAHGVDVNIGMRGQSREQCLVTELPASAAMRIHDIADKRDN